MNAEKTNQQNNATFKKMSKSRTQCQKNVLDFDTSGDADQLPSIIAAKVNTSNIFGEMSSNTSRFLIAKKQVEDQNITKDFNSDSIVSKRWNAEMSFLDRAKEINQISMIKDLEYSKTISQDSKLGKMAPEIQIEYLRQALSETRNQYKRVEKQNKVNIS